MCVRIHISACILSLSGWKSWVSGFYPGRSVWSFNTKLSTISRRLQVSVSAHQFTHRDHLSNYTKVALTPFLPWCDQMTPLSLPSVQAYWHLAKQKRHRLWLLCDFTGTAGYDALSSLNGPTSHMTLSGCENAVIARMLSWVSHNLWEMCHPFYPLCGREMTSHFDLKSWHGLHKSMTTILFL